MTSFAFATLLFSRPPRIPSPIGPQPQNTIFLLLMNEPSLFLFGLSKSVNFCFPVVELIVVNAVSFVKRKILTPALRFFNSEFSARGLSDL